MANTYEQKRYLTDFETQGLSQIFTDCLVIGSGVAGLRAAIEAAKAGRVLLITKASLFDSNTSRAQGGVAVVLQADQDDSLDLHMADTVKVGCGINDLETVRAVISQGPRHVRQLIDWGAKFDSQGGELDLGREAGHSASRVIHAMGDATGEEIVRVLTRRLEMAGNVRFMEDCFVLDLLTVDRRCLGALVHDTAAGVQAVWAKQTILAAGGCGRVYQETTNPEIATGDGIAMAYRAGTVLEDMEMMQFHPTTLYVAGASRALISEAVRGEGAYLVDADGYRFMSDYHPDAELAPRDVVSRAIIRHIGATASRCVYLDVRHIPYQQFTARFPHITQLCESFDIDIHCDLIPVRPSAHYMIGGVKADLQARTNINGLLACGEVACSGLHGANRLASNSLLEGLVFGRIAGDTAALAIVERPGQPATAAIGCQCPTTEGQEIDLQDIRNSLRSIMWRHVAMHRSEEKLAEAVEAIEFWGGYVLAKGFDKPSAWECENMLTVAWLMAICARQRTESRGVHYRTDFPKSDRAWRRHVTICRQIEK